ncbi:pentatricopeptide repeat-containing protein At4g15720 [Macadamia integrifolia]|uniref:pentatricopeptide repeat-containing protein At4g15720 n=1 Tax=Macadamia integrifolia TaxID=60698 RepID=UPI001C4F3F53|nr:pentatricopeptide repeat-containing protein At4g15720 [Macadamia integrifolia]
MRRILLSISSSGPYTYTSRQYCASLSSSKATQFVQQLRKSHDLESVISIHSNLLQLGFLTDTFVSNHLINGYVRLRRLDDAYQVFEEMPEPDVVSWTSLMAGYIDMGKPQIAFWLFERMLGSSAKPNAFTFATMVNACSVLADIENGRKLHAMIEMLGFQSNLVVCTALIDMYGKSNNVDEARRVFNVMGYRNIVSWTSMVAAYAQNARSHDALQLFGEFIQVMYDPPNHFMLASVINACASLGRLVTGKVTHATVIRGGHHVNDVVATALVDMYAKCGCFAYSDKVFQRMKNPCVISYTSMIVGAAKHGLGKLSLDIFEEMLERGIRPNDVTFVGVLHACSHSGFVNIGLEHLHSMKRKYGIMPDVKHYICAVDMLGRAGCLDEAYKLAKTIQTEPDDGAILWGTLLSTSRTHGKLDLALEAGQKLLELNRQVAASYVTMSNAYASAGKWENVHRTRSEMKQQNVYKEPGCSWIEVKEAIYVFYAGDVLSCIRGNEVVHLLRELEVKMKERGYVQGGNDLVSIDVEEEAKDTILSLHSERLALGFGLITIPKGVTIRIMKNLRMCRACHEAFKLISEIVKRDFIVRDVNRFHHFKDGFCNCKDYW